MSNDPKDKRARCRFELPVFWILASSQFDIESAVIRRLTVTVWIGAGRLLALEHWRGCGRMIDEETVFPQILQTKHLTQNIVNLYPSELILGIQTEQDPLAEIVEYPFVDAVECVNAECALERFE